MLSGDLRVDGDDAIAMVLQRPHDFVARSIRPVRCAYHHDGTHRLQAGPDFLVGREWHVSPLSPAPPPHAWRSPLTHQPAGLPLRPAASSQHTPAARASPPAPPP